MHNYLRNNEFIEFFVTLLQTLSRYHALLNLILSSVVIFVKICNQDGI
jgi:hypothetical protein